MTQANNRAGDLVEQVVAFQRRILQDALAHATAEYWLKRAEQYEWARPRPGDFVPTHVTRADRQRRWDLLTAKAQACRHRATLATLPSGPHQDQDDHDIDTVMNELANQWHGTTHGAAA